ncbi:metallophosphoesterase [Purpureocillium lilacinum]|nr:metallophosphoesterase [Purpureocillium lilacinum]OAQ92434.1 metallophosphoesterase [Purpureocillium lilacinum]
MILPPPPRTCQRVLLLVAALAAGLSHQAAAAAVLPRAAADPPPPLRFRDNGTFHLSVFSDLHFGEDQAGDGPAQDRNSVRVLGAVLDAERPDLVVLNGDLINGDSTYRHNSTHYVDQVVGPIVERQLTWASTYGNHDHQPNINGDDILKRERNFTGCRTQKMVHANSSGTTNYYLPVYAADCSNGSGDASASECAPELLLWFFDSRGGFYYQGGPQPNWVDGSVVSWFNATRANITRAHGGRVIPSLAFVHIPINATGALQSEEGVDSNYQPGINEEEVVEQGEGWCADGRQDGTCTYGGQDVPFMRALAATEGLVGLFYGHDHANSWCYKWDALLPGMTVRGNGINLCYGQHSGYGGYGDWARGGRQILVSLDKLRELSVDTHIRLETGDVVGAVTLNSTFNKDSYPASPDIKTYMSGASGEGYRVYTESTASPRHGTLDGQTVVTAAVYAGVSLLVGRLLHGTL